MTSKTAHNRISDLAEKFKEYNERYETIKDERAVCALAFHLLHLELSDALKTNVLGFSDVDWVAMLSENFANRFFNAMNAIDDELKNTTEISTHSDFYTKSDCKPWIDVYLAICTKRSYVFECLMFPLSAHIGYDLPLALVASNESKETSRINDYYLINEVLAKRIDIVQQAIKNRYHGNIAFLDKITGQFDEFLTNYGIRVSRAVSWYNANRILDSKSKEHALSSIEKSTRSFILSVRKPKKMFPRLINSTLRTLIPTGKKWPKQTLNATYSNKK